MSSITAPTSTCSMSVNPMRGKPGLLCPDVRRRRALQQRRLSNEEYFEILARELTKALTEQTHEGYVYRVDLRLRAEGSVGQLTRSLDDYAKYYRTRGQVWERLALLKAWPIAGSQEVGRSFIKMVRPFVLAPSSKRPGCRRGARDRGGGSIRQGADRREDGGAWA